MFKLDQVKYTTAFPANQTNPPITNKLTISTISCSTKMNFNTTISSKKRVSFIDVQISLPCLPIMILAISQKAEDRRGAKSWVQKEEGAGLIRKLKVPRKNCFLFRIRSFHCPSIFFLVQCLQPTNTTMPSQGCFGCS